MLIDEIIDLLSSQQSDLAGALLKTKVLLHTLGEKELANWINNELNGYPVDGDVPSYRTIAAHPKGTIANMAHIHKNTNLPLMHLDDEMREVLTKADLRQSVATLEQLSKGDRLGISVAPETWAIFDQALDGGYHVQSARKEIAPQDVTGVLLNIRSRLLDFVLELRTGIGIVDNDAEVKSASKSLDVGDLFRSAVFGNNATIIVGHDNRQVVDNRTGTDDLAGLIASLRSAGVADSDLSSLQTAIAEDKKSGGPSLSKKTGKWFTDLASKSASGALTIGTNEVVTTVLDHLRSHLGL